jgi:transcriptional regulator with XRE-family HTH domain
MQAQEALTMPALPKNRLRELREARGWKLYDVSVRVRVDPSTVHRWERGESTIPDRIKIALAEFYDVTPGYLMGWDDAPVAA